METPSSTGPGRRRPRATWLLSHWSKRNRGSTKFRSLISRRYETGVELATVSREKHVRRPPTGKDSNGGVAGASHSVNKFCRSSRTTGDSVVYHFRTYGWSRARFYSPVVQKSLRRDNGVSSNSGPCTYDECNQIVIVKNNNIMVEQVRRRRQQRRLLVARKNTQNSTAIDKRLKRKHNTTDFRKTNGTRYLCGIHRRARVGRRNFLRSAAKTRENDD